MGNRSLKVVEVFVWTFELLRQTLSWRSDGFLSFKVVRRKGDDMRDTNFDGDGATNSKIIR